MSDHHYFRWQPRFWWTHISIYSQRFHKLTASSDAFSFISVTLMMVRKRQHEVCSSAWPEWPNRDWLLSNWLDVGVMDVTLLFAWPRDGGLYSVDFTKVLNLWTCPTFEVIKRIRMTCLPHLEDLRVQTIFWHSFRLGRSKTALVNLAILISRIKRFKVSLNLPVWRILLYLAKQHICTPQLVMGFIFRQHLLADNGLGHLGKRWLRKWLMPHIDLRTDWRCCCLTYVSNFNLLRLEFTEPANHTYKYRASMI